MDIETILTDLSNDSKERLKNRFSNILVIGNQDNYEIFRKFFNKKTNYYYSKRIRYSPKQISIEEIAKDIYPILIDNFL